MAATDAMHQDFARWYGLVSFTSDHAIRQARWEGVTNVVAEADFDTVEALLRLAHRSRQLPAPGQLQAIRDAFKAADEAFEMSGNDRELQVLAAICLATLMDGDTKVASLAALAASTTGLGGGRTPDLPMDLGILGEGAIVRLGDLNRNRPNLAAHASIEPPKFDFEKAVAKAQESTWESVAAAFTLAAESSRAAMKMLAQRQANFVNGIGRFVRVQDEELQMLWWLIGQRSIDFDCAFDGIPTESQPLVFGSELADCTEFLPGPPSIKGILSRTGLKERKKIAIAAAVNAAESDWLQSFLGESDPSPVSTPIHAAIKRRLETGSGDAWIAGWAASSGVNGAYSLSALNLGSFFYRERLLLLLR
jgi:hypothetical protein